MHTLHVEMGGGIYKRYLLGNISQKKLKFPLDNSRYILYNQRVQQLVFFRENRMKIQKVNALNVECNNEVYLNTYVSSWSGNVELKFNGYESDGSEYKLNVQLPLDKARALAKELTTDLENYDKEMAAKARRELEEATEE